MYYEPVFRSQKDMEDDFDEDTEEQLSLHSIYKFLSGRGEVSNLFTHSRIPTTACPQKGHFNLGLVSIHPYRYFEKDSRRMRPSGGHYGI